MQIGDAKFFRLNEFGRLNEIFSLNFGQNKRLENIHLFQNLNGIHWQRSTVAFSTDDKYGKMGNFIATKLETS